MVVEEVEEVGGANGRIGGIGDGSVFDLAHPTTFELKTRQLDKALGLYDR